MHSRTQTRLLIATFILAVACAAGCKKGASGGGKLVTKAQQVADLWVAKDWATMRADFDAKMTQALPPDALDQSHSKITTAMGKFVSRGKTRKGTQGEYDVIDIAATFEKGPMTIRVVFDKQTKIAGFFVLTPKKE